MRKANTKAETETETHTRASRAATSKMKSVKKLLLSEEGPSGVDQEPACKLAFKDQQQCCVKKSRPG